MPVSDHIRKKLSTLPHKPGVYLMRDRFGTVIYVGKARDLRRRVSQYFHPSRRRGWDLKLNALVEAIHDLDIHQVRSDAEALLLENKLIKEFRPRYNVSFKDDKNFLLIKVNVNDPIPRFTLTRIKVDDGARYFGPYPSGTAVHRTLNLMRQRFNLRGCKPLNPTKADYQHCLYAHLKVCTAPCIGNVNGAQYKLQVLAACDFLDGQCVELMAEMDAEMRRAAAAQEFERAAKLRDFLEALRHTSKRTKKFERVPYSLPTTVIPSRDLEELLRVLDLPRSPARIEGFDISNISGTFAVASLVVFKEGRPERASYRRFRMKGVEGQDDFACIAEAVRRRYTRLRGEMAETPATTKSRPATGFPDLILIDGGKGQLNAACAELAKLGLASIPIFGLAKEFEELHRPGEKKPLRLSHDSGALRLLQRVRDESHRFANTYNAQLRLKKISESLLDEFPGIGATRKAALLKRFGSVQRLRLASLEQIAEVRGFGGKAAASLKAFLAVRPAVKSG